MGWTLRSAVSFRILVDMRDVDFDHTVLGKPKAVDFCKGFLALLDKSYVSILVAGFDLMPSICWHQNHLGLCRRDNDTDSADFHLLHGAADRRHDALKLGTAAGFHQVLSQRRVTVKLYLTKYDLISYT